MLCDFAYMFPYDSPSVHVLQHMPECIIIILKYLYCLFQNIVSGKLSSTTQLLAVIKYTVGTKTYILGTPLYINIIIIQI